MAFECREWPRYCRKKVYWTKMAQNGQNDHFGQNDLILNWILAWWELRPRKNIFSPPPSNSPANTLPAPGPPSCETPTPPFLGLSMHFKRNCVRLLAQNSSESLGKQSAEEWPETGHADDWVNCDPLGSEKGVFLESLQ